MFVMYLNFNCSIAMYLNLRCSVAIYLILVVFKMRINFRCSVAMHLNFRLAQMMARRHAAPALWLLGKILLLGNEVGEECISYVRFCRSI
jgi:hypothetical protein